MPRIPEPGFSRSQIDEGELQLLAGISLIESSGLVRWNTRDGKFDDGDDLPAFDKRWQKMNLAFGRVILWHTFATGVEYFLKGMLLLNGEEVRFVEADKRKLDFPHVDGPSLKNWADKFFVQPPVPPKSEAISFGQLGDIVGDPAKFKRISARYRPEAPDLAAAFDAEMRLAYAGLNLLRDSIRNRDAHAYIPNVRNGNFALIRPLYLPALNIVLSWVPEDHRGEDLTRRIRDPRDLVQHLVPTCRLAPALSFSDGSTLTRD